MNIFKKSWEVIVRSSADPRRTSLMVKGILLGVVTFMTGEGVQMLNIVCEFGYSCYYFDPSLIDHIRKVVDMVVEFIYYALMALSIFLALYGYLRKMYLTFTGQNPTLQTPEDR